MITATQWATTFLQTLGIQATQNNIDFVLEWIQSEGQFGSQYNPLNAFGAQQGTTTQSAISVAQWMQTNGGYGGTGTYAQELIAFLSGGQNQLAKALSYWCGGGGQIGYCKNSNGTVTQNLGYQNLIANFSPGGGGYSEGTTAVSPGTTQAGSASNLHSGWGAIGNFIGGPSWIQQLFQNAGWLLIALALIIGGIIWLAVSELGDSGSTTNQTINKVSKTKGTVVKAATKAGELFG